MPSYTISSPAVYDAAPNWVYTDNNTTGTPICNMVATTTNATSYSASDVSNILKA